MPLVRRTPQMFFKYSASFSTELFFKTLSAKFSGFALLACENIKYHGLKISTKIQLPTKNCLIVLGLARSHGIPEITPFQEILNSRFNLNICNCFC